LGFNKELVEKVKKLAPAGFRLVKNGTITDPVSDFIEGMPEEWIKVYVAQGYAIADPVLLWSTLNSGAKRWSEIELDDFLGVLQKAKAYGLNYGVVVSKIVDGRFSIISVARDDREYTDDEIAICTDLLQQMMSDHDRPVALKQSEKDVLQLLSQGHSLENAARDAKVSISTLKYRLNRARLALGAKSSIEAVAKAVQQKLI